MKQSRFPALVMVVLCSAWTPAEAGGQELAHRAALSPAAPRRLLLPGSDAAPPSQPPAWTTSARLTSDDAWARTARAAGAQSTRTQPRERGVARKVLGAAVGAAGGFFAGGYLGAAIEGDRCHCDDPGLKGAVIGAPIGAAAGGILGALYLF